MSQIEELNLGGPKCRITDRGLEALLHLRELRRFTMAWAPLISDTGIANLAAGERLEHVDLMGTILSRLTMLERLEFSEIAGISDAGLKALVPLPRLRKISVSGSPKVTRAAMAIELFAWIRFSQPVM